MDFIGLMQALEFQLPIGPVAFPMVLALPIKDISFEFQSFVVVPDSDTPRMDLARAPIPREFQVPILVVQITMATPFPILMLADKFCSTIVVSLGHIPWA